MQIFVAVCAGLGLAAACGLRVFLPLFMVSICVRVATESSSSWLQFRVPEGFYWMGDTAAIVLFGVAAVVEVAGFLFPWVDHALDVVAVPLSTVAGALMMTIPMLGLASGPEPVIHPATAWTLGIIAGGGAALGVEATSVVGRVSSSVLTTGWLNPVYGAIEAVLSFLMVIMSIVVPILAGVLVMVLMPIVVLAVWRFFAWRRKLRVAQAERLRLARERIAATVAQRASGV